MGKNMFATNEKEKKSTDPAAAKGRGGYDVDARLSKFNAAFSKVTPKLRQNFNDVPNGRYPFAVAEASIVTFGDPERLAIAILGMVTDGPQKGKKIKFFQAIPEGNTEDDVERFAYLCGQLVLLGFDCEKHEFSELGAFLKALQPVDDKHLGYKCKVLIMAKDIVVKNEKGDAEKKPIIDVSFVE
jgi:hypothetical protein